MLSRCDRLPYWQIATLAILTALWAAVSALLALGRGDTEAFLLSTFRDSARADAFTDLNRTLLCFWVFHSCLLILGSVAARFRQYDVFTVMIIGPAIGFCLSLFSQQWSDPNWTVFIGVCLIGWLVGIVVGGLYWAVYLRGRTRPST